jgi:hypothetical protein
MRVKPIFLNPRSPSSRTMATINRADPPACARSRSQTSRPVGGIERTSPNGVVVDLAEKCEHRTDVDHAVLESPCMSPRT